MIELLQGLPATIPIVPLDASDLQPVSSDLSGSLTSVTIQISGNSTVTASAPTLSHRGSGQHSLTISGSDLSAAGLGRIRIVITDCVDIVLSVRVVAMLTNTLAANVNTRLTDARAAKLDTVMLTSHINATNGRIDRVTLVDTCTANTDMRGTNDAALASSLPANFTALLINASGYVTVGTNTDKSGYSLASGVVDTIRAGLATEAKQDTAATTLTGINNKTINLPANPAAAGDAMTLTAGERNTLYAGIDLALVNAADGTDFVAALTDAIAANLESSDLSVQAIASAVVGNASFLQLASDAADAKTAAEAVPDGAGIRTAIGLDAANLTALLGTLATTSLVNARTKLAEEYFDPATDTVANVTTVGTVSGAVSVGSIGLNALDATALDASAASEIVSALIGNATFIQLVADAAAAKTQATNAATSAGNIETELPNLSRFDASTDPTIVGEIQNNVLTGAALDDTAAAELAAMVESYIVNEGDATSVLQAIADKVAQDWVAGDASPVAIVAALKADPTFIQLIADATAAKNQATSANAAATTAAGLPDAAEIQTQARAALEYYHLHRLFQAAYDPANKPGDAAGLLNVIMENNGGVPRLTEAVLALAPAASGGGTATVENQTAIIELLQAIQGNDFDTSAESLVQIREAMRLSGIAVPDDLTGDAATDLATIRGQLYARLMSVLATTRPTYNIDGQSVSWADYQRLLLEQINTIDAMMAGQDPVEQTSRGIC